MIKLVRFQLGTKDYTGFLEGNRIYEIWGDIFGPYEPTGRSVALADVRLLPPCTPSKVVGVGLNYRKHAIEMEFEQPQEPLIFLKATSSIIAAGEPIIHPPTAKRVDFEGELAVVVRKTASKIAPEDAPDFILGYTIANDVTARDIQKSESQWARAKSFDTFLPLGPVLVRDIDPTNLQLKSFLNGRLMQSASTSEMIFNAWQLVSFISHVMTLQPGDVIITGSPEGVAPMKPGDYVEVSIENIGTLGNPVQAASRELDKIPARVI